MVLHTTYFGPVSWYAQLARCATPIIYIEAHENFVKQTTRSRCRIATANGVQTLSVPVNTSDGRLITDVRITDHANWRHQHWNALSSAYGESPFFDYYADDIRALFEPEWDNLFDYNLHITKKMCELLQIEPDIRFTEHYEAPSPIEFTPRPYYQVFAKRHGFIGDLSILDLLFNEGNEAILKLM